MNCTGMKMNSFYSSTPKQQQFTDSGEMKGFGLRMTRTNDQWSIRSVLRGQIYYWRLRHPWYFNEALNKMKMKSSAPEDEKTRKWRKNEGHEALSINTVRYHATALRSDRERDGMAFTRFRLGDVHLPVAQRVITWAEVTSIERFRMRNLPQR